MRCPSIRLLAAGAALFCLAPVTQAATFCVGTVQEFRDALTTANSNGEADTIRVRTGTYAPTTGSAAFSYGGEGQGLTISGGWLNFGMNPCVLQNTAQGATVLSGSGARRVMSIAPSISTSPFTLSRVTLRDGASLEGGAGLRVGGAGYAGTVTIEHVVFNSNVSEQFGGAFSGGSDGGTTIIRNSLFIANMASVYGAAAVTANADNPEPYRFFFGHNTVVANSCGTGACTGGVRFGGSARGVFYNNVFAFNEHADISIDLGSIDIVNNLYDNVVGLPPIISANNLTIAVPGFVGPLGGDFRLLDTSPLRDAGTPSFNEGTTDLDGNPRFNGNGYDIGAYESQTILFADSFELTL